MGGSSRGLGASLGSVLLVGVLWFLFVGILADGASKVATVTVPSNGKIKFLKFGTEGHGVRRNFGLNYVSKRRVPNGPDPIHNRVTVGCPVTAGCMNSSEGIRKEFMGIRFFKASFTQTSRTRTLKDFKAF